jgi:hypothetical protein
MAAAYKRVQPDRIKNSVMHILLYNTCNSYCCEYRSVPLTPDDLFRNYQDFLTGIFDLHTRHVYVVMPFEGAAIFIVTKTIFHEDFNFDWPQILHEYSCKPKDFTDMLPWVEWK